MSGATPRLRSGSAPFVEVRAGYHHTCGLTATGVISCWGDTADGAADAPERDGFVQVATSRLYVGVTCGLTEEGSLQCWGSDEFGSAPAHREASTGRYVSVSTSGYTTCALRDDGGIECFGDDTYGNVSTAPTGKGFVQLSTNAFFSCALRADGRIRCWGDYALGEPPPGPFVRVTAGTYHACGLRADGTVECWGTNAFGQLNVPPGLYTDVEAGEYHVCAVTRTRRRRATCWGRRNTSDLLPLGGNHVQVTTGGYHNCALERSGRISCWGAEEYSAPDDPGGSSGFGGFILDGHRPPIPGVVLGGSPGPVGSRLGDAGARSGFIAASPARGRERLVRRAEEAAVRPPLEGPRPGSPA